MTTQIRVDYLIHFIHSRPNGHIQLFNFLGEIRSDLIPRDGDSKLGMTLYQSQLDSIRDSHKDVLLQKRKWSCEMCVAKPAKNLVQRRFPLLLEMSPNENSTCEFPDESLPNPKPGLQNPKDIALLSTRGSHQVLNIYSLPVCNGVTSQKNAAEALDVLFDKEFDWMFAKMVGFNVRRGPSSQPKSVREAVQIDLKDMRMILRDHQSRKASEQEPAESSARTYADCTKAPSQLPAGTSLKTCSRCKSTYYCSKACQKEDWPEYKPSCLMPAQS